MKDGFRFKYPRFKHFSPTKHMLDKLFSPDKKNNLDLLKDEKPSNQFFHDNVNNGFNFLSNFSNNKEEESLPKLPSIKIEEPKKLRHSNSMDYITSPVQIDTKNNLYNLISIMNDNKLNLIPSKIKSSEIRNNIICSMTCYTDPGPSKIINEDRIIAMANIARPKAQNINFNWPKCSYFGIFDGHEGQECSDYILNNLHEIILNDPNIVFNTEKALKQSVLNIDKKFEETSNFSNQINNSGASIVISLFLNDELYIANLGDCKALLCNSFGQESYEIIDTIQEEKESSAKDDLIEAFDKAIKLQFFADYHKIKAVQQNKEYTTKVNNEKENVNKFVPQLPKKCRSLGNFRGKSKKLNSKSYQPDVKKIIINNSFDFLLLGSSGVYSSISSKDIRNIIYQNLNLLDKEIEYSDFCRKCVEKIIQKLHNQNCKENISIIFLTFRNFKKQFQKKLAALEAQKYEEKLFETDEIDLDKLPTYFKKRVSNVDLHILQSFQQY